MSEKEKATYRPGAPFFLGSGEMLGVFLALKERKSSLDPLLARLMRRMEQRLYEELTIDEFENLPALYRKKIDFEPTKD
jgi:hypothetical protein